MTSYPKALHKGMVVGVAGDKLTTTCSEGNQYNHTLAKDATVTCDGKVCQASDLKAGTTVQVTTRQDDESVATSVESGKHIRAVTKKTV